MWKSALTNIRTASKLNFAALVAVEKLMLVLGLETRECRSTELCGITKRTVEQFANYWMSQVTNGMRWLRRCCCVRCCCCGDGAAGRTRVRCSVFDCVLDWMGILYAVRCWVVGVHTARRSLHDVMSFSVLDARDGWICVVNKSLCCTVLEVRGWRCERTKWMRESERAHTRPLSAVATACGTHFSARGTWMAWLWTVDCERTQRMILYFLFELFQRFCCSWSAANHTLYVKRRTLHFGMSCVIRSDFWRNHRA